MQRDLANNENDWQLKKLQHDSLKTAEKVVEVLRETIEKEVLALGKDYERLFGSRSAQFAEYLTMVTQKLEQHGVQHQDVINWLNSAASEGSVPRDYASDLRDSQSKTVPFIPGGPMQDFGEQSLLDKSLGNMGVSSARPVGMTGTPVANGFDPASVFDGGNSPHFPTPPVTAPVYTPSGNIGAGPVYGADAINAVFGAPPANDAPAHNGHNIPAQAAHSQSQISIPRPAQPTAGQNGGTPNSPNAYPPSPFGQPSFGQPEVPQPVQATPSANLPITTSQPAAAPNQAFAAMPRREDKKDDENKYTFDPFTAWD